MKNRLIKFSGLLMFTLRIFLFHSCQQCIEGEGEVTIETIHVESFAHISVDIDATVVLMKGDPSVTIEAQPNIKTAISATVKNNKLTVKTTSCFKPNTPVKITIYSKIYNEIDLKGNVNLTSVNLITAKELTIRSRGESTLKLDVFVNDIEVKLENNSQMTISGNCQNAELTLKNNASFEGAGFNTFKMDVDLSGSGRATVNAFKNLKARLNGSGEILYSGDPQLDAKIDGTGRITKLN
jgi:hypothetical protein